MRKILLVFLAIFNAAWAKDPVIDVVNQGVVLPKITARDNSNLNDANLKRSFYNMIVNDLKVSSNFEVVDEGSENSNYIFEYILAKNGENLSLNTKTEAGGVEKANQDYTLNKAEQYPFLAHKGVRDSVQFLGLTPVEWMDHKILIARINSSKRSQIIMVDYTFTYQRMIVDGGLNLFPKWANEEQTVFYYTAYDHDKPTLFRFDLTNNKASKILSSGGMVVASDVNKESDKILATMVPQDQPGVYLHDLNSRNLSKLTNYSGINVNANFIGEGESKVVFVSDRLGYPNIFIQNLGSTSVEQAVSHGRNNPTVSTYRDFLVYSSRKSKQVGVFNIYLMSIKSDYIRQLSANGKNLSPRFSNDDGSIVFIKHLGNQSTLGVIRVNASKTFYFPLKVGRIQPIDW